MSDDNPYQVSSALQSPAMPDTVVIGDVEISPTLICIPGDTELPSACIHCGQRDGIERRELLGKVPSTLQYGIIGLLCCGMFLALLEFARSGRLRTYVGLSVLIAGLLICITTVVWLNWHAKHRVRVTWYVHPKCKESDLSSRILGQVLILVGVAVVVLQVIPFPGPQTAGALVIAAGLIFVGIVSLLPSAPKLRVRTFTRGRFHLTGHSRVFSSSLLQTDVGET